MSRYIDADKLKKEGWHLVRERRNKRNSYIEGMDLDCVPTAADVVDVVRCKDCKHSDTYPTEADNDMPLKCLGIRYGGVMADWFCEHGERKDGAE